MLMAIAMKLIRCLSSMVGSITDTYAWRLIEINRFTGSLRRYDTREKLKRLREIRHAVIEMWDCEFYNLMVRNKRIKSCTDNHPLPSYALLEVRDAFYGGHIRNIRTYHQCHTGEKIRNYVFSPYPWVCKYEKFLIGHPKAIYVGVRNAVTHLMSMDSSNVRFYHAKSLNLIVIYGNLCREVLRITQSKSGLLKSKTTSQFAKSREFASIIQLEDWSTFTR